MRHTARNSIYTLITAFVLTACGAGGDNPGLEYAPNMYHSVPYEPLTQITDESAGGWVNSREDSRGEYYNSNPYNPFNMNMRVPPANTVKRREDGMLPYRIPADSIELASRTLTNPLDSTEAIVQEGQALYAIYCMPCHGGAGQGDGAVGQRYLGIPAFNVGRVSTVTEGHIFHVITHGYNRMSAYGSQIDIADRWKIVEYVQQLQLKSN